MLFTSDLFVINENIYTMIEAKDIYIRQLKDDVEAKFGRKIAYASDCESLSEQIQISTNRQLSSSTLKRIFGIIKSTFELSKFTLDTLSMYIQYPDWQAYTRSFEMEDDNVVKIDSWYQAKEKILNLTNASLESLKNKVGDRLNIFPVNKVAQRRLKKFLSSSKIATALISIDSYNRSTIIAQLTVKFFTGGQAKFPDDIVFLIDGGIFFNLVSRYSKDTRINNLIEYNAQKGFAADFREFPESVRGRMVVIIDCLDDIYSSEKKTNYFIENLLNIISTYENIDWFKLVITCSPRLWRKITNRVENNEILKSLWFDVNFEGTDDEFINIPLFKPVEIESILRLNNFPYKLDNLCFNHPDILEIIRYPSFLYMFLTLCQSKGEISDIDLLNNYIRQNILNAPFSHEKYSIIVLFFTLCDYGLKGDEVLKNELNLLPVMIPAYIDLLKNGVLSEYLVSDKYLSVKTYVKFSNHILFSYYLANILIKMHELDMDFLKKIITDYQKVPRLQHNILGYVVKILFVNNQFSLLKNIHSFLEPEGMPENIQIPAIPSDVLMNVIVIEMRRNKSMRDLLIPWYAQTELGCKLYFERHFDIDCYVHCSLNDIEHYLEHNQSNEAKQYASYVNYIVHFLCNEKDQCSAEYENSVELSRTAQNSSLETSFHLLVQIMHQSYFEKRVDLKVLELAVSISEQMLHANPPINVESLYFEYMLIFALAHGKNEHEIVSFADKVFKNYDLTRIESSCLTALFKFTYAKALLNAGETQKALDYYDSIKLKNVIFPVNMKYFILLKIWFIKVEFLIFKGNPSRATHLIDRIKDISQMLEFTFFYNKAVEMEELIAATERSH